MLSFRSVFTVNVNQVIIKSTGRKAASDGVTALRCKALKSGGTKRLSRETEPQEKI